MLLSMIAAMMLGYQLDISRDKVPTMPTLYRMVDLLSELGYNQFQLYTEHTFAYSRHEEVWCEASPMLPDEVRALDAYCAKKGIELVPNQNSFGHLERWLMHPGYNDLAEAPKGGLAVRKWGGYILKRPMALCPTDPRSIKFVAGLYDELFPCFRSRFVNVGGDEVAEVLDTSGQGRSVAELKAKGGSRVYLDFLLKIHREVKARGHEMMFWGDIVLDHPELIPELPADSICLNWGYEANHPFARQTAAFRKANRRFVVCPGTSAWGSLFGRVPNMMGNIDNAITNAVANGAEGVLVADWGDGGHPQPWIVSIPALVYTAHRLRGETLSRERLAAEIDKLLGCTCGEALMTYGELYLKSGGRCGNSTELYHLLIDGAEYVADKRILPGGMEAAIDHGRLAQTKLDLTNAPQWVKDDFELLALLLDAVETKYREPKKKNFRAMFEPDYRRLWLKQNRRGGLQSSVNRLLGGW